MKTRALFSLIIGATLLVTFGLAPRAVFAACPPACGIAFSVDSTGDGGNVGPNTQCDDGTGHCTLRAALQASNSHPGQDGIFFSLPAGSVINLTAALPSITDGVDIIGPGADKLTVQRNTGGNYRIFNVLNNGSVSISGLTIANGFVTDAAEFGGGGIQNGSDANRTTATVTLTNCIVTGNQAYNGGGIHNRSGTMNLNGCLVTGNQCQNFNTTHASGQGGGIYNFDTMTITNSEVDRNTANGGNGTGIGGGVFNESTLHVVSSTISRNIATSNFGAGGGAGGGIYNDISFQVTNSTIALNESIPGGSGTAGAGGILSRGSGDITNCTIASNLPSGVVKGADPVNVKSSIIAKNSSSNLDVSGSFTSAGFNLIGAIDGSTGFTAATDQTGTAGSPRDPMFDPTGLQNNGGPAETIALLAGSPAIDKGTSSGLTGNLSDDERGVGYVRTIDGATPNAAGGDGTDIGAFEVGAGLTAVSQKTHAATADPTKLFTIPLSLTGNPLGVESRRNTGADSSGPNAGHDHEVVVTFPRTVTVGGVSVSSNDSSDTPTATSSVSSNVVTIDLHNIQPIRRLSINLSSVNDGTNTNDVKIPMGVLLGDVNGSARVDAMDVTLVRQNNFATLTQTPPTFRKDVNVSGRIDSQDVTVTRQQNFTSLP